MVDIHTKLTVEKLNGVRSFILFTVVGFAVYAAGLTGRYFADDFKYVFQLPSSKIFYFFAHANPATAFYRPVQSMVLAAIQSVAGDHTWPVHVLTISLHILLSLFVFFASKSLGIPKYQSLVASFYMLVSQANALAVLSNDTLSQVGGTLCGYVSLWLLFRILESSKTAQGKHNIPDGVYVAGSICLYAISIWMKESSLSFLLDILLLIIMVTHIARRGKYTVWNKLVYMIPYILVTAAYLTIRASIIQGSPDPRYELFFGLNIIENILLFAFAAIVPFSTAAVFTAFVVRNFMIIFIIGAITLILVAAVMKGLWKSRSRLLAILSLFAIINLFPMAMFHHVSELYVYNSMPIFSILIAIGGTTAIQELARNRFRKIVGISLTISLLALHIIACQSKAMKMTANGQKAERLLSQILPFVSSVPEKGHLILMNPAYKAPEYSVICMNGFNVLSYGTNIINQESGRSDITVWLSHQDVRPSMVLPENSLILTIKNDSVQRMEPMR